MKNFKKEVFIGRTDQLEHIYCGIKFVNDKLSISGEIGRNCFGQIQDELQAHLDNDSLHLSKFIDKDSVQEFLNIWDKWHLNNLTPGSPRQEKFVKNFAKEAKQTNPRWGYDYDEICSALKEADLLIDKEYIHNGKEYRYGSAWLFKEVPADALEFLQSLPDVSEIDDKEVVKTTKDAATETTSPSML